jgi:hypothetical protein
VSVCCQQDDRRDAVRKVQGLNGLDYVEVSDDQRTLTAYFLGKIPPEFLVQGGGAKNVAISGGRRITGIQVESVKPIVSQDPEQDDAVQIKVDKYGDFSNYTLSLVNVTNVDPRYQSVTFSFKINCQSDLDCAPQSGCEPLMLDEPEINYLAKDYASFRQLILDRLSVIMPAWTETHAADIGIALVEVLAYTADYLSYYQDAVATEAYLGTARQRISVRRLTRLVDYRLSEGCNARAFVCLGAPQDVPIPAGYSFITGLNDALAAQQTILTWAGLQSVPATDYEVFEPFDSSALTVYAAHNQIRFYTWGEKECCMAKGSTSATFIDAWVGDNGRALKLAPGDYIVFEEVIGPRTGMVADADPKRRQVVRLTSVDNTVVDNLYKDANGRATALVNVEWAAEDKLQFTFCISTIGPAPNCIYLSDVSVARGNVILVDHGQHQPPETFGPIPALESSATCECAGEANDVELTPGKLCPVLKKTPLTYRQALPADRPAKNEWTPASTILTQDIRRATPQVWLTSTPAESWSVRYDLIESQPGDWNFVVELDDNSIAHLRFGDGNLGAQPPSGMTINATYRIGNGTPGNVGAEAISRIVLPSLLNGVSLTVRNPLPAQGGTDAEPIAEAKLYAPHQFLKTIERAITADDYQAIAERNSKIQRAAAALNWTGSWYEADVAIDPWHTETASPALLKQIDRYLERFRKMGQDLAVLPAVYVPLDLEMEVCALPQYERAQVKAALLDAFSRRRLPGGKKGFFHPDYLTFGQGIYLSKIIQAALEVTGVECVTVTKFQRLFAPSNKEIANGILPLATNEIAQLDNDPNYPEHGKLVIDVKGGR